MGLLFKDRTHLETDVPVEEVVFLVHSHDYGAWGTCGSRQRHGRQGSQGPGSRQGHARPRHSAGRGFQPRGRRVGKGKTYGRSRTDDDEAVAGRDTKGDGLTLYDEYRGLLVLEKGQRVFRRLDPARKELFVIDKGGSFDPVTWEKMALIKACKVDESLTEADSSGEDAPMVNHLSPTAPKQVAYAVRIETVDEDEDRNPGTNSQGGLQPRTSQLPGNWVPELLPSGGVCEIDGVLQGVSREGPQAGDLRRRVVGQGLDGS